MREVRMLCWFASAAVLASAPVFAAQGSSSPRVQPAPMSALVHPVRPLAGVSVAASGTSSSPQALKSGHAPIAATVALLETTSVGLSVARALTELGISYDEYSGSDFSAVNLAPYQAVILAMDGGAIEDPTIANIQGYVSGGGKVLFVGGTCYQPFALAVEARLLDIDSVNYCWTTVAGSPDLTVVNAGHVLAKGLPATYDFIDTSATYYMARNQDGAASVAAVNGDGFAALLSKTIGSGTFDWFINSPYDFYWSNDPDYQILKQIVKNALLGNSVILIHTTSVAGSVGQALTDLGVGYDDFSGSDFSAVDLTSYQTVIVAMDGGVVQDPSVANIQSFANNGGNLVMFGGSALIDFATAVDTRLLDIDLSNYFWITVSSSPNFSVTDAGHRLSQALPATYDYANISASYYMIRNQDGAAQVAAQNGDGFDDRCRSRSATPLDVVHQQSVRWLLGGSVRLRPAEAGGQELALHHHWQLDQLRCRLARHGRRPGADRDPQPGGGREPRRQRRQLARRDHHGHPAARPVEREHLDQSRRHLARAVQHDHPGAGDPVGRRDADRASAGLRRPGRAAGVPAAARGRCGRDQGRELQPGSAARLRRLLIRMA
ncbi:MAG: hypothetical protein U1E76_24085 [Planctomycetota bacterium]